MTLMGVLLINIRSQGENERLSELKEAETMSLLKTLELEVSASVTNLFNRKEYSYTSYGTVSQYERSSKLRGREFMVSIYLKK